MMQADLFGNESPAEAYARHTDPRTSHEAAEAVNASKLEAAVLAALRENGPMTTVEASLKSGIPLWSLSPRMAPLERKSLIERAGTKMSVNSSGRQRSMTVWKAKA